LAINNIDENNRARDRLVGQLRAGRLIGCTGAGLSWWAGYPLWKDVVSRLAGEVKRRRPGEINVEAVLQHYDKDLLLCAQRLGNDLPAPAFAEFIRTEFGPKAQTPHDILLRTAALPLRHVLTLNFDTSYETAVKAIRQTCGTISPNERGALAIFLRDMHEPEYPRHAVHLHGKFDDPIEQIALTDAGYDSFYRGNPLFENFVWTMSAKRLVFLGFGFSDTQFTGLLNRYARDVRGTGPNHFGLIPLRPELDDNGQRAILGEKYLVDPGVVPWAETNS